LALRCRSRIRTQIRLPPRTNKGITVESDSKPADAVVLAVAHDCYRAAGWPLMTRLLRSERGLVIDVKGVLDLSTKPEGIDVWRL